MLYDMYSGEVAHMNLLSEYIHVLRGHNQKGLESPSVKTFSSLGPQVTCIFTFAAGHF